MERPILHPRVPPHADTLPSVAIDDALPPGVTVGNPLDLRSTNLRALYGYWLDQRGARSFPTRADIKPSEIKYALRDITLADVIGGGRDYHIRLAGSRITQVFGKDFTGLRANESGLPDLRRFALYCRAMCVRRAPIRIHSRNAGAESYRYLEGENIVLPLSSDGRTIDMVLMGSRLLERPEEDRRLHGHY